MCRSHSASCRVFSTGNFSIWSYRFSVYFIEEMSSRSSYATILNGNPRPSLCMCVHTHMCTHTHTHTNIHALLNYFPARGTWMAQWVKPLPLAQVISQGPEIKPHIRLSAQPGAYFPPSLCLSLCLLVPLSLSNK